MNRFHRFFKRVSVVILLFSSLGNCIEAPDVTLIAQYSSAGIFSSASNDFWCVVNDTTAISWTLTDPKGDYPSEYFPKITEKFSCSLENGKTCTQYWLKNPWTMTNTKEHYFGPILDRRWESFPVHTTEDRDGSNQLLQFLQIGTFKNDFTVAFSVKIKYQAQIFFCDGFPDKSACYWFLIGGWDGHTSALRKCDYGQIPIYTKKYPRGTCAMFKSSVNHTEEDPYLLKEDEWTSFMVSKKGQRISLKVVGSVGKLLDYHDDEPIKSESLEMFILSRSVQGFWKIHFADFLYTTTPSKTQLGPTLQPTQTIQNGHSNYHLCLKLFAVICEGCILKIRLTNSKNIYEKIFRSKAKNTWQEIRFVEENVTFDHYTLFVITYGRNDGFWAIDDVRQCSIDEVRVATITTYSDAKISCQLLQHPSKNLAEEEPIIDFDSRENLCPVGTFGKHCTNCDLIFGENSRYCQGKKLCTFDDDFHVKCRCSHGYTGENCDRECSYGTYGVACSQNCGECFGSYCDKMAGVCPNGCHRGFLGDLCKVSQPTLVDRPKILEVGNDFCNIQLQNDDIIGNLSKPEYYQFQISSNKQNWTYVNHPYLITDFSAKLIGKLDLSTTYYVRAVLISADGHKYESDEIPFAHFETTCTPIQKSDLEVTAKNTSAVMILKTKLSHTCPMEQYQIYLSGKLLAFVNDQVILTFLEPFTNYSVTFYRKRNYEFEVNFATGEGVPSAVIDALIIDRGSNFISLTWKQPETPNGKIRHYTIVFQNIGRLSCEKNLKKQPQKLDGIRKNHAILENLEPYSKYLIKIYANTIFMGIPVEFNLETLASELIDAKELPKTIKVNAGDTSALIELNEIPCQNQMGPIYVDLSAECSNEWCSNARNFNGMLLDNHPLKIDNLEPYSDYVIKINFKRPNGNIKKDTPALNARFRTLPGVPQPTRNLSVYSQTKNEAFLSWLPPYPPGGVLMLYQIAYVADGYSIAYRRKVTMVPEKCPIWHEKHCSVIGELDEERDYHFQVFARNNGTDRFNYDYQHITPSATKTAEMKASSKPKLLGLEWKNDDQLILTWYHPDFTSGLIRNFQISIKGDSYEKYEHHTIANRSFYNLTYRYQIQTILKKSSKYTISVSAVTYINHGLKNSIEIYTPPEQPRLIAKPQILDTMNNTIKLLVPPYDSSKSNTNDMSYLFIILSEDSLKCSKRKNNLEIELIEQTNNNGTPCILIEVPLAETAKTKEGLTFHVGYHRRIGSKSYKSYYLGDLDSLETPLREDASYNLSVLLLNEFEGVRRYKLYRVDSVRLGQKSENDGTMDGTSNLAFLALLLFLAVPLIVWFLKKKNIINLPNIIWLRDSSQNSHDEDKLNPDLIPLSSPKTLPNPDETKTSTLPQKETVWSKPIKISDLEEYVKKSISSGELERQHQKFERGITKQCEYGLLKQNQLKNRYKNLAAYDHTRVRLEKLPKDEFSDYINANYIDGYKKEKAYIATQGPKISTLGDFWRMIWQERVKYVVMLANLQENGKKKCEKYWPDLNESVHYGDIKIRYVSSDIFADYEYRVFDVARGDEKRSLQQLHFTSWPDHGVPLYPQNLVPFLKKISSIEYDFPIVVHCSAGVGRTGTIILCDVCLRMAYLEEKVDFLKTLQNIREQRINMVDNADQYKLAHLVLLECLVSPCTTIPCNSSMKTTIERIFSSGQIEEQMKYLQNTAWQNEALLDNDTTSTQTIITEKNRFQEIIPDSFGRVFLQPFPIHDESSTYINAVVVDGYRSTQKYIVTQQPLPNTVGDFWKLVVEKDISVIVSLNSLNDVDKTTCPFWPDDTQKELRPTTNITLNYKDQTDAVVYQIVTIKMEICQKAIVDRNVTIIAMNDWKSTALLPAVPEKLLLLCEEVTRMSRNDNHVLVTCYDGATACGLFVSMAFVVEKIKLEQECDVCLAVRTVRRHRRQFVTNREQFKFLYEAALKYIEEFETYSNFASVD